MDVWNKPILRLLGEALSMILVFFCFPQHNTYRVALIAEGNAHPFHRGKTLLAAEVGDGNNPLYDIRR